MSMSLSCSSVWITLSGLKSQYTSPRSCRYPSAGSTSTAYAIACASGTEPPSRRASWQDLLERLAAHVLHHDVPGRLPRPPVRMLHEVVDPHDIRVFHLGEELALGDRGGHGVGVAGVEQALEHHPAVADVVVPGQVDPAEPAEGEAAEHLVLPGHQVARLQLRAEREPGAAVAAETLGQPGPAVLAAPDGLLAARAEATVLRDLRVGEDGAGRVAVRAPAGSPPAPRPAGPAPTARWCAGIPWSPGCRWSGGCRPSRIPPCPILGPDPPDADPADADPRDAVAAWAGAAARPQTLQ